MLNTPFGEAVILLSGQYRKAINLATLIWRQNVKKSQLSNIFAISPSRYLQVQS